MKLVAGWMGFGIFTNGEPARDRHDPLILIFLALIFAFVYTFSQENRNQKARLFVISLPMVFLPWAMMTLDLVVDGPAQALLGFIGIVAAHLYDFLTRIYPTFGGGRNWITTPGFVRRLFSKYTAKTQYRNYGTAYRGRDSAESSGTSWTSSLQGQWSARGQGRRLGGG